MANQIVVSAGAKVRNLSGVLTATSGVVSSVPLGAANGVATLDSGGKVPVSQLPSSVVTYLGTWNAATNTPTLVNGVGDAGDMYICNVAGSVNFGAGPVTFAVGDWVLYGSGTWQKSSGQNGTVTSVAASITGNSVGITGSPISTAGTLAFAFAGTNLQYVNGAGNLTTFPDLTGFVPYTGATANVNIGTHSFIANNGTYNSEMSPSLFGVENAAGTIFGVLEYNKLTLTNSTGAGSVMEVNAQGLIFPDASVQISSYTDAKARLALSLTTTGTSGAATYNNTTGVFNIPNYGSALSGYVPYTGATQDVDLGAFKLNAQSLHIKGTAGNGHLGLKHQSASATASANEVSLFADSLGDLSWLNGNLYLSKFIISGNTAARSYTFPNATCNIPNDSLVVHLAGTETITGAKTFSGYTTFTSTVDITSGLTFSNSGFTLVLQPPTLSVNRTVTLPNGTGTLALTSDISYPVTSVFGRTGAVVATSGDYTTAQVTESGNLYFTDSRARLAISLTTTGTSGASTYNNTTGVLNIPQYTDQFVGTVTSVAALTIGTSGTDLSSTVATSTTTPVITLNVPTASAANRGALSSADWTTFNNKQSALTNPVTGTGTTNYLPKFTGASTIGNSIISESGGIISIAGRLSATGVDYHSLVVADGSAQLRLERTTSSTGVMYLGADNVGFKIFDSAFATRLTLTSGGNLGLGVTPSAWSNNGNLQFDTYVNISSQGTYGGTINNNAYYNAGWKYIGANYATQYQTTGGEHRFLTAGVGSGAGAAITFTQAMTLTAAGRLLIGTPTEASYMLDVNGTGRFSNTVSIINNTGGAGLSMTNTAAPNITGIGSPTRGMIINGLSTSAAATGAAFYFYGAKSDYTSLTSGDLFQVTNNDAVKFRLDYAGAATFSDNLIVRGNTSNTIGAIRTQGATSDYQGISLYNAASGSNANSRSWQIAPNYTANGNFEILVSSSNTTDPTNSKLTITSGGNVLIGTTTNATGLLQVNGTIYATGFFESSSIKGKDIIATNPLLALDIDVIKYTRKSDESKDIRYGYSAEQIHSLMPELTDKDVTAVKYLDVHTILISQLQKEIKELKAKMN